MVSRMRLFGRSWVLVRHYYLIDVSSSPFFVSVLSIPTNSIHLFILFSLSSQMGDDSEVQRSKLIIRSLHSSGNNSG